VIGSNQNRWLLPEGIEELLPSTGWRLEHCRREILDLFHSWGYDLVSPPLIEYLESLLVGNSDDLDLKTFKTVDQSTGRLLGVRSDITPQVARMDAHQIKRDVPTRLCYQGEVLHARLDDWESVRNPLQIGAELYGDAGVGSDIEIIHLMLQTLNLAGYQNLHIDLGHSEIFRALATQAELSVTQEQQLFEILQRKSRPDLDIFLAEQVKQESDRKKLHLLVDLHGDSSVLNTARDQFSDNSVVADALDVLQSVFDQLSGLSTVTWHFDLAELRGYHYHTGLVFSAYQAGCNQALAQGGRYDNIGEDFGRARPATGFSFDLRALTLNASTSCNADNTQQTILAPDSLDEELQSAIDRLRTQGNRVIRLLPEQSDHAAAMGCDSVLVREDKQWVVKEINDEK
jgi:ATP phosphoribosyltransferase regulatory subunit